MLRPSVAVLPAHRRASAVRRFPPGCGRHHNAADDKTKLPHGHTLPVTSSSAAAAATKPKPSLPPNQSVARAADKAAPPRPRRAALAAASTGIQVPSCGVGSGKKAPAAAANVRRVVSAVRRFPPGCGRGADVSKPPAPVGEGEAQAGAGETTAVVGNGGACDREEMLRAPEVLDEVDAGAQRRRRSNVNVNL